jgi:hypothetical protein
MRIYRMSESAEALIVAAIPGAIGILLLRRQSYPASRFPEKSGFGDFTARPCPGGLNLPCFSGHSRAVILFIQ